MGSILSIISSVASVISTLVGWRKQEADQQTGEQLQVAADLKETTNVQKAELQAVVESASKPVADSLRDGTF